MIAQVVGIVVGVALMAAPAVLGYAGSTASDVHRTIGPTAAGLALIAVWQATRSVRLPNIVLGIVLAVSPVVVDHPADAAVVAVVAGAALVAATPFAGRERRRLGGGWRAAWPLHAERSNG